MKRAVWITVIIAGLFILITGHQANASPLILQDATPFPTVTGTPEGPKIIVPDQVNVRVCPSTACDLVGVLISGQEAFALGRTEGGEWIQITYPGVEGNVAWVYSAYVVLDIGQELLPIIEPQPTPTPKMTPTIDPTLAAQFNLGDSIATPLPTYTPAAPVVQPTFENLEVRSETGFPPIIAILGLVVVGLFGTVISVLRGR